MSFPAYPEYKKSRIGWAGDIPKHWYAAKLRWLARLNSGNGITANHIEEDGKYPVYGGNGIRGFTDKFTHKGLHVLIGRQGALCGNINYGDGRFWASEHAVVVEPTRDLDVVWLGELLRSMNLNQYSIAAAQPGLAVDRVSALAIPVPPQAEQRKISHFLRHETAKIDALIREQERLIELLQEKRQAVISHAVTKGLDPDVAVKDSGVEWLGEVPAHWNIARLKYISPEITVGIVVEPSKYYVNKGIPALRSLNVKPGKIVPDNLVYISPEANVKLAKSKLNQGDLVAVRSGQPGTTAVVPKELHGCNCIDLIIIRKPLKASEHYLSWYLASDSAVRQFSEGSGGAIQQHFNISTAGDIVCPLPPKEEQNLIDEFLKKELADLAQLAKAAEDNKKLLSERRSALISAAVTGKIDVRDWQPPTDESAFDEEVRQAGLEATA